MHQTLHLTRLFRPHIGGVETHVREVVTELKKKGLSSIIVTSTQDKTLPDYEKTSSVEIYRINDSSSNKIIHKLKVWWWVIKHYQLFLDADVIQAHDVTWWIAPIWPVVRKKLFTTFHGWEGVFPIPVRSKLARLVASKISVGTIHVGDWIREFYWDRPDIVTYGGVRVNGDKDNLSKQKIHEALNIVFFGRLSSDNDVLEYIQLVKIMKRELPKIQITWVGNGPLKIKCENQGKVTGMVKDPTKYLETADLVLSSSYLSILEAQARSQVVCSLYSHRLKQRYLESFPGAEFMVLAGSADEAWTKLKPLLNDEEKMLAIRKRASDFAKRQTWSRVVSDYQKLWQKKRL